MPTGGENLVTVASEQWPLVRLTRIDQTPDGTFGRLLVPGLDPLVTTEDDWLENVHGKSCIPAGRYELHRSIYIKHNIEVFEVVPVPHRSRILIHPGNTEEDSEGCILPGLRFGMFLIQKDEDTGKPQVYKQGSANSRVAFNSFMQQLAHVDRARLDVSWAVGLPKPVV